MGLSRSTVAFSAAEYLRWESEQSEKYEYLKGTVIAMGGASRRHVTVSGNIFVALDQALAGTSCRVYMADMKLRVLADVAFFYPDVFVTCDPADHRAEQYMSSPVVVFEVISPPTEGFDRGEKFAAYRRTPSLKEFVLIDPEQPRIEYYRRTARRVWELHDLVPDRPLMLNSLGLEIEWSRIFRNAE